MNIHAVKNQRGQALITFIFFVVMGVTIISAATIVLFSNTLATTTTDSGQMAYYLAESGAEDGLLQILRDPAKWTSYGPYALTNGETDSSIVISNGVITSSGKSGSTVRIIQVQTAYSNGIITVSSWKEVAHP